MSKGHITLHPKYGVNPTIPTCFWCGKDKNEIILLGASYRKGTGEAPMHMLFDYNPCDKCQADMAQGITFVEVVPCKQGQLPIDKKLGVAPTGRIMVVKEEAVSRIVTPPELVADILAKRKCYIPPEVFDAIFPSPTSEGEAE